MQLHAIARCSSCWNGRNAVTVHFSFCASRKSAYLYNRFYEAKVGGLAQLARALAWHARGHRFDSDILHPQLNDGVPQGAPFFVGLTAPPRATRASTA